MKQLAAVDNSCPRDLSSDLMSDVDRDVVWSGEATSFDIAGEQTILIAGRHMLAVVVHLVAVVLDRYSVGALGGIHAVDTQQQVGKRRQCDRGHPFELGAQSFDGTAGGNDESDCGEGHKSARADLPR
jgi:hypothetical protein